MTRSVSRRDFVRTTSATLAAGMLPGELLAQQGRYQRKRSARKNGKFRTERVILIAFAGGCRSKEVIGQPDNVPNLMRIAAAGCTMPNIHAANLGHYGATLSIFTGNREVMGIRENERGLNPTVFEYLRKDAGFQPNDCWLSTAGGAQARLFSYSMHSDYGADFGANLIDGDGIFNAEFKSLISRFGKPRADSKANARVMERLQAALGVERELAPAAKKALARDADSMRRIERFIVDEINGTTTRLTGPGSGDAKAIRIGANIFRIFRPKVLGITLQAHDVAHSSYNGYVEVIRRNDAEIGRLWDAIQQDEELAATTSILVSPEFGRDKNLNERQGLDHGDGSDDLRKVFLIAAGPDFKKGKILKDDYRTFDIAPTVLSFFGVKPRYTRARPIRALLV